MLSDRERRRYDAKVGRTSADGCWLWLGGVNSSGYGQFGLGYRMVSAHRIAFVLAYGPIPTGCVVMHSCDNPRCCNPTHLRTGTHAENMADMAVKGRSPHSIPLSIHGITRTRLEWARVAGVSKSALQYRVARARRLGLPLESIMSAEVAHG